VKGENDDVLTDSQNILKSCKNYEYFCQLLNVCEQR